MAADADRLTLSAVERLAEVAGAAIMAVYGREFDVTHKGDASPVTEADHAAEDIIVAGLRALDPTIPIVAEESMAKGQGPAAVGRVFWLVDPLDGTKEFIRRNGDFTVNIALIEDGKPVLGVVYAPARAKLYGGIIGQGATRRDLSEKAAAATPIRVRRADEKALVAVASKSHRTPETDIYLNNLPISDSRSAGSSLKFCLVAEGSADIYPRFGTTMEWDTAAGDAVLRAAGGAVTTFDGKALVYGKPGFANPYFLARGDVNPSLLLK